MGVFEQFRTLKVIAVEMGFAWAPSLAWRLDALWKRMRSEVPHVVRPPPEQMKQHIWLTTQPIEEPENVEDLRLTFDWIGWDKLLFATDYPHWDFDDPSYAIPFDLSEDERGMLFHDNAASLLKRG